GKGSVSAGVRVILAQRTIWRSALVIIINRNPRLLERQDNIWLIHSERQSVGERVILNQQIKERFYRVFSVGFRDFCQSLDAHRQEFWALNLTDQNCLGP